MVITLNNQSTGGVFVMEEQTHDSSGDLGHRCTGRVRLGDTIEEQTERTMRNITAILRGAGLNWSHVVNTTAYLEHLHRDWAGFDRAYGVFLTPPYPAGRRPARR